MADIPFFGGQMYNPQTAMQDAARTEGMQLENQQRQASLQTSALNQDHQKLVNNDLSMKQKVQTTYREKLAELSGTEPPPETPEGQAQYLSKMARLALAAGDTTEGTQLMKAATDLQRADTASKLTRKTLQAQESRDKSLTVERAYRMLSGVNTLADWNNMNSVLSLQSEGKPSPFAHIPYSPENLALLKAGATTEWQKIQAQQTEDKLEAKRLTDEQKARDAAAKRGIAAQNLEIRKQAEQRRLTNGGGKVKPVGTPNRGDITIATEQLKAFGLTTSDGESASTAIAAEAKARRMRNPGLSSDEATAQVVQELARSGQLVPATTEKGTFFDKNVAGKSFLPTRPVAMPTKKAELVTGQFYQTPRGTARWNGQVFEAVGGK